MAPDPRHLRAQRFPLHAAVESGDLARVRGLLEGPVRWAYFILFVQIHTFFCSYFKEHLL